MASIAGRMGMGFIAIILLSAARPDSGDEVKAPVDLWSKDGLLEATLHFRVSEAAYGRVTYRYTLNDGSEAPTLRVNPGDKVTLHIENEARATNVHFHGLGIPPVFHQDEVLRTVIGKGESFEYRFRVPIDQSPGLYWYHPHLHGSTEEQVLGGASGAMIVGGLESRVGGSRERVIVLRDQLQPGQQLNYMEPGEEAEKDVSVNFAEAPATIVARGGEREFWRVLNAAADTYFELQIVGADGRAHELELIALDGSPLETATRRFNILIPPGGRTEFVITAPENGGRLISRKYDTGRDGANNPERVLANLTVGGKATASGPRTFRGDFAIGGAAASLRSRRPVRERRLYFSEDRDDLTDPTALARYYITEEGAEPKVYDMMRSKPDISVEQGTVEDWVIENRAREAHTFHIHQLHFLLLERDGKPAADSAAMDTVAMPYWDGRGTYPSVKLRMDFRSPEIVGTFLYHCHILEHEDLGMMGTIQVTKPRAADGR